MGEYTAMRFRAKLTQEAEVALRFANGKRSDMFQDFWDHVTKKMEVSEHFLAFGRRNFIPRGAMWIPEEWGGQRSIVKDRWWDVVCSAKDYGYHPVSMMETFINDVLPDLIQEPCFVEIIHETWEKPKIHEVIPTCGTPNSCSAPMERGSE